MVKFYEYFEKLLRNYYRVMLGKSSIYSDEAYNGKFVGVDFLRRHDLSKDLINDEKDFKKKFNPIHSSEHPEISNIAISQHMGYLWKMIIGFQIGDIVLCPDGSGNYFVGEIVGEYQYCQNQNLPHRRNVSWYPTKISRQEMSNELKNSTGSIGTISNISKYSKEIDDFLSGTSPSIITTTDETIENTSEFALEQQLEKFLIENWSSIELSKNYDIVEDFDNQDGQQFSIDGGRIDILAISKDKKTLLVIELKRGRTSDVVVGQCLRYMGYVKNELAEENQNVHGMIIAHEEDHKILDALSMTQDIEFYTYKIDFDLTKREIRR